MQKGTLVGPKELVLLDFGYCFLYLGMVLGHGHIVKGMVGMCYL